jgi:hypothetical protein
MSIRSHARIQRMIASYPRCTVCSQPMCCGQKNTHLSCRPEERLDDGQEKNFVLNITGGIITMSVRAAEEVADL